MLKSRKNTKHDPLSESCYSEAPKKYAPFLKVFSFKSKIFSQLVSREQKTQTDRSIDNETGNDGQIRLPKMEKGR